MPKAYLFLGSNINAEKHIPQGLHRLKTHFDLKKYSPMFQTASTVNQKFCFYNLAAIIHCHDTKEALFETLRKIEKDCGRVRVEDKNADRTLDIDIVIYQDSETCDQYPVDSDLFQRHFMAKIFSLLEPDTVIPPLKKSFSAIVDTFPEKKRHDINLLSPINIGDVL